MHPALALGAPTYRLQRRQWVPGEMRDVFRFFEDPRNLERITPPWLNFSIRQMSTPQIQKGTRITYRVAWMGLPMKWVTLIEEWEPGRRFVDTALVSPYILWRHEHTFSPEADGITLGDLVTYRLPFGPIGSLMHAAIIRRQLEAIFDYRAEVTASIMSGGVVLTEPPTSRQGSPHTLPNRL